jgi:molecular chaperone GrpE
VQTRREALREEEAQDARPPVEAPVPAAAVTEPRENRELADQLARLQEQNRELLAEVERGRVLAEEKEQHARQAAEELERAKARIAKEARKEVEQNKREVLVSMLEVLDDLDRAIAVAEDGPHDPAFLRGVRLVRKNFLCKLAHFDVEHAPCLGDLFDPARHDAVSMVPVREPEYDGTILGVIREGYAIGQDILRPAAVAVGRLARVGHS